MHEGFRANDKVVLNIPQTVDFLDQYTNRRIVFEADLKRIGVEYLHVTYEALTLGCEQSKTAELQRISDYILGNNSRLIDVSIFQLLSMEQTHDKEGHQALRVQNYDELVAALTGTRYAELLH